MNPAENLNPQDKKPTPQPALPAAAEAVEELKLSVAPAIVAQPPKDWKEFAQKDAATESIHPKDGVTVKVVSSWEQLPRVAELLQQEGNVRIKLAQIPRDGSLSGEELAVAEKQRELMKDMLLHLKKLPISEMVQTVKNMFEGSAGLDEVYKLKDDDNRRIQVRQLKDLRDAAPEAVNFGEKFFKQLDQVNKPANKPDLVVWASEENKAQIFEKLAQAIEARKKSDTSFDVSKLDVIRIWEGDLQKGQRDAKNDLTAEFRDYLQSPGKLDAGKAELQVVTNLNPPQAAGLADLPLGKKKPLAKEGEAEGKDAHADIGESQDKKKAPAEAAAVVAPVSEPLKKLPENREEKKADLSAVLPELSKDLRGSSRDKLLSALGKALELGHDAAPLEKEVAAALRSDDPKVRAQACAALGAVCTDAEFGVQELSELLFNEGRRDVRAAAMRAFDAIVTVDKLAVATNLFEPLGMQAGKVIDVKNSRSGVPGWGYIQGSDGQQYFFKASDHRISELDGDGLKLHGPMREMLEKGQTVLFPLDTPKEIPAASGPDAKQHRYPPMSKGLCLVYDAFEHCHADLVAHMKKVAQEARQEEARTQSDSKPAAERKAEPEAKPKAQQVPDAEPIKIEHGAFKFVLPKELVAQGWTVGVVEDFDSLSNGVIREGLAGEGKAYSFTASSAKRLDHFSGKPEDIKLKYSQAPYNPDEGDVVIFRKPAKDKGDKKMPSAGVFFEVSEFALRYNDFAEQQGS